MLGFGILLGGLSMLIGFAALWLAADARNRAGGETAQLMRSQGTLLRKSVDNVAGAVAGIDQRLKDIERRLAMSERESSNVDAVREELLAVRAALGSLREATTPRTAMSTLRH